MSSCTCLILDGSRSIDTQEQPLATVRASVLIYDDARKRWLPAGDTRQQIEAKVQLFHHVRSGSYRIVARQVQDMEAVLNCQLYPSMKYNFSTPTFHQWRSEQRRLYGLNFLSPEDAQRFGHTVLTAVQELTNGGDGSAVEGSHTPTSPSRPAFAACKSQSIDTCESHAGSSPCTSSTQHLAMATPQPQQSDKPRRQTSVKYISRTASTAGDYASQRYIQQRRMQEEEDGRVYESRKYNAHTPLIQKHQQQGPGIVQQHTKRRLSAGSNGSGQSVGVTGTGMLSAATQTSNLIFSTVSPPSTLPAPSLPIPPPPQPGHLPSKIQMQNMVVPPPPPPPPPVNDAGSQKPISLTQAITSTRLRKVTPNGARPIDETPLTAKDSRSRSVGSVESGLTRATNSSATLATNSAGSGHSDVISEMAATLARRRMIVESGAQLPDEPARIGTVEKGDSKARVWDTRNGSRPSLNDTPSSGGAVDSPKTHRKMPSGSSLSSQEEGGLSLASNGTNGNRRCVSNGQTAAPILVLSDSLDQWKQEILTEVRRELSKAKSDIIDALRMELNRR